MKQDTTVETFLKKLVMGQGSFSAKCTRLILELTF